MHDLFRDSPAGQLIRFVTKDRVLQYPEEKDPAVYEKCINQAKSRNMKRYGSTEAPSVTEKSFQPTDASPTRSSTSTRIEDNERRQNVSSKELGDLENGRDVDIVDWYGPDDPDNPQNWSLAKKCFVTGQIIFLTFSVYIGSAIYSAGVESVISDFHVSREAATLGLTLFVFGYGIGPMLWAPMSEIPTIGRNPVYITTLFVFVLLQIPTALSVNFGMLLAFRFITGFFGSPPLATGGASIADMYSPSKRAYGIGLWGIGAILGPVLGPLIGGFAVEAEGWRWTIWELMWLSGFCFIFLFLFFPETSSSNMLVRRTKRLRKITGNENLRCEPELMAEHMTGHDIMMMTLVRPFTLNFVEPMVFLLNLYIALIYALLYTWFESFPIVFNEIYGMSLGISGLAYLGLLVGAIIVVPPFFWYLHKYTEPQFNESGDLQPEKRLPPAFVGGFAIPICLFWFGWSAGQTHWIVPIIGTVWFSIGAFLLFNSVLNYLGDAYPDYAASVLAGNDFMRSMIAGAFPLIAIPLYKNLGVPWATSLLGFLSIVFIPIPLVLYKYGHSLRLNHSKYARKDI